MSGNKNNIVSNVRKRNKVKAKLDTEIIRYEGEEIPSFHLLSLEVDNILNCPYCGRKFTTVDTKKAIQPTIQHEINEDYSTQRFEIVCFKCSKEFRFDLFTSWYDNAFGVSFTVEETADLTTETIQHKENSAK